jgi:hypothetical protein
MNWFPAIYRQIQPSLQSAIELGLAPSSPLEDDADTGVVAGPPRSSKE